MTDPAEHDANGDGDDFMDTSEETHFSLAQIDTQLMTNPVVLRAIGGIVLGLAVLAWPDRSDRILARLLGAGLALFALSSIAGWLRSHQRHWTALAGSLLSLTVAAGLLIEPDQSTVFLGRVMGAAIVANALYTAHQRTRDTDRSLEHFVVPGFLLAVGVVLIVQTASVLSSFVAVGAITVVAGSLLALFVSLDARTQGAATYQGTADLVLDWLKSRPKSVDARQGLYGKILYEGPTTSTRIIRFFTLMGFASVIASMGVITDSTAVVIGAMLVAPLMTPLMGMSISLVMGWPNRLRRSAVIAAGGILFAIAIGTLLGLVLPTEIDVATNSQILARTSPTTLDLITAIAAGAAGAYGLSRPDVSDSLPGVAIAISLVPPLTVAGISYSQGDFFGGNGAVLLFATNMIAILIVGGLTFIMTGVTPLTRVSENQHRVRTALGVTCTAAVLVIGALFLNGAQITANSLEQSTIDSTVKAWLAEGYNVVNTSVMNDQVTVVVVGPAEGLSPVQDLANELSVELDRTIVVDVSLVVEERLSATSE